MRRVIPGSGISLGTLVYVKPKRIKVFLDR